MSYFTKAHYDICDNKHLECNTRIITVQARCALIVWTHQDLYKYQMSPAIFTKPCISRIIFEICFVYFVINRQFVLEK